MSSTGRSRACFLACVLAPAGAVLIARAVLPGAGPLRASAQMITPGSNPKAVNGEQPPQPREPSNHAEMLAAVDQLLELSTRPSPFVSQVPRALTKIVMTTPEAVKQKLPEFSLTSIAGGTRQTIAMIDGKVRRVGDDLGDGWTVSEIEPSSGQVTLTGPSGLMHTLTLRK